MLKTQNSALADTNPPGVVVHAALAHFGRSAQLLSVQAVAAMTQHHDKSKSGIDRLAGIAGIASHLGVPVVDCVRSFSQRVVRAAPEHLKFERLSPHDRAQACARLMLPHPDLGPTLAERADELLVQDKPTRDASGMACAWTEDGFVFATNTLDGSDVLEQLHDALLEGRALLLEPRLPMGFSNCTGLGLWATRFCRRPPALEMLEGFDTMVAYSHDRVRESGLLDLLSKRGVKLISWDATVVKTIGGGEIHVRLNIGGKDQYGTLAQLLLQYS